MSRQLNLSFGVLSPKIAEQLTAQSVGIESERLGHFQKDADAVSRLHVRGLIPDSTAKTIREKLMKKISFAAYPVPQANTEEAQ